MAQASSIQREPSMEEILASIRRIIEDSDTVRKEGDAGAAGEGSDTRLNNAVIEVDAFRAELRAAQNDAGISAVPYEDRLQVSTELQPGISQPQHEMQTAAEPEPQPDVAPTPPAQGATFAAPSWDVSTRNEAAPSGSDEKGPGQDDPFETAFGDLSIEPARNDKPASDSDNTALSGGNNFEFDASSAEPPLAEETESPRPAILSEQAGRQVAAAFGELSEAFAARSRKTFDDMAAEMMRPMLQDWLDNNLPTLVERLVREEIERVARGGS